MKAQLDEPQHTWRVAALDAARLWLSAARGRDATQTLGLTADWNVGADFNADMSLKANLNVSRETTAEAGAKPLQQAGSVNMQMKF